MAGKKKTFINYCQHPPSALWHIPPLPLDCKSILRFLGDPEWNGTSLCFFCSHYIHRAAVPFLLWLRHIFYCISRDGWCTADTEIYGPLARSGNALEGSADISPALWRRRIKADVLLAPGDGSERGRRVEKWGRKGRKFCFFTLYFSVRPAVTVSLT